ncbi:alpha-glucosidase (family GH31 glycosyl hydrolase) [Streptomyces sp. V4I8]
MTWSARYRRLTGAASMPPRWAFGFIQSTERYHDQEELLAVARRYVELGLPLEGIVLDWMSWPDGLWGQKSLDPARFPDAEDLCRRMHDMGTKLMVSIWPHVHGDGTDQLELAAADAMLANGTTYDAFDPKARALYWKQAETALFAKGVDAWWTDCSEPFEANWNGAREPSPEERMRINTTEVERYLGPDRRNAYSLLHSRGIWEGQRATGSPKRVLNLTRSAYPGRQRYGTYSWSGDIVATWESLRRQVAEGLSFAASGLPYWTTDVGAFFPGKVCPGLDGASFLRGDFDAGDKTWATANCSCAGSSTPPSCRCCARTAPARRARSGTSTATVLVLIAGQFSGAVSASFVVADAGLVLASSAPG